MLHGLVIRQIGGPGPLKLTCPLPEVTREDAVLPGGCLEAVVRACTAKALHSQRALDLPPCHVKLHIDPAYGLASAYMPK